MTVIMYHYHKPLNLKKLYLKCIHISLHLTSGKVKVKVAPVHAMEACRCSNSVAPLIVTSAIEDGQ
jgi:hypothetical protein